MRLLIIAALIASVALPALAATAVLTNEAKPCPADAEMRKIKEHRMMHGHTMHHMSAMHPMMKKKM